MKEVNYKELMELIVACGDRPYYKNGLAEIRSNKNKLEGEIKKYFGQRIAEVAVLGVDILQYSQFRETAQHLVPILFQNIYNDAIKTAIETEPFILSQDDFSSNFVNTGDGGFTIFDSPLKAFVFSIYLQATFARYNAHLAYPILRDIIKEVNLRYSLTFDKITKFEDSNYFGPAIINSSRLLSKDTLNRFLIDEKVHQWFLERTVGIESLSGLNMAHLSNLEMFKDSTRPKESVIFGATEPLSRIGNAFQFVTLSKIGFLKVKSTELNVYNLYVQVSLNYYPDVKDRDNPVTLVVSLGNLNASGI